MDYQLRENLEFEVDAASAVYHRYGEVMYEGIWGRNFLSSKPWFPSREESTSSLIRLETGQAPGEFVFTFSDGTSSTSVFDESSFFKSFYTDEKVSEQGSLHP